MFMRRRLVLSIQVKLCWTC